MTPRSHALDPAVDPTPAEPAAAARPRTTAAGTRLTRVARRANTLAVVAVTGALGLSFGLGEWAARPDHSVEVGGIVPPEAAPGATAEPTAVPAPQVRPSLGAARAAARPIAALPLEELPQEQASLAQWIARRYAVAQGDVARLVHEAWRVGQREALDPLLLLAVMAIESRFDPRAQSPVGAQGLMQVMTHVHDDKFKRFGGARAAFDPIANLRVGAQILQDCIERAGSLEGGLRHYVGAANLASDGGYAAKVLAERTRFSAVFGGRAGASTPPAARPDDGATATAAREADREAPRPSTPSDEAAAAEAAVPSEAVSATATSLALN